MDDIFKGSDYNGVKSSSRAGRGDVFIACVGSISIGDASDVSYNERNSQENDEMRRMCEFSTVHAASCRIAGTIRTKSIAYGMIFMNTTSLI